MLNQFNYLTACMPRLAACVAALFCAAVTHADSPSRQVARDGSDARRAAVAVAQNGTGRTGFDAAKLASNSVTASAGAVLPQSAALGCLDVDGNTVIDNNDVLLVARYLLGFRGTALTANAIGANASRFDPADVLAFLQSRDFDADGNRRFDMADALLLSRFVAGSADPAFNAAGAAPGAQRRTRESVATHLGAVGGCVMAALGLRSFAVAGALDATLYVLPGETRKYSPVLEPLPGVTQTDFTFTVMSGTSHVAADNTTLGKSVFTVTAGTTPAGQSVPVVLRLTRSSTGAFVDINLSVRVLAVTAQASGSLTAAGGSLASSGGTITFSTNGLAASTTATVTEATTPTGETLIEIAIAGDIAGKGINIKLPPLAPVTPPVSAAGRAGTQLKSHTTDDPYAAGDTMANLWQSFKGYRLNPSDARIPANAVFSCEAGAALGEYNTTGGKLKLKIDTTAELSSSHSMAEASAAIAGGAEPVLFVHGFKPGAGLGGGEGTWKRFPALVQDSNNLGGRKFIAFELRWASDADFRDAAGDLALAINLIKTQTGKNTHMVAHSFGGVLVRTLLQNLARGNFGQETEAASARNNVASLLTLGSPHSGIMDVDTTVNGVALPGGQDSTFEFFEACPQIACHVMGEPKFDSSRSYDFWLRTVVGIDQQAGEHPARLAQPTNVGALPAIPIFVGIGLTADRGLNEYWDAGDGLISYRGQRFSPAFTAATALLNGTAQGLASVTEVILGSDRHATPGTPQNDFEKSQPRIYGYAHNGAAGHNDTAKEGAEAAVEFDCGAPGFGTNCTHAGYQLFKRMHTRRPLNDTGITFCGGATSGNNSTCLGTDPAGQDRNYGRDAAALAGTLPPKVGGSASVNGFDFSKISNSGTVLLAGALQGVGAGDWACTKDNVTGLLWEVKTDTGLRGMSHSYTWFKTGSPDGNNGTPAATTGTATCATLGRCDTEKYVQDVNAAGLCGATTGWRMPTVKELEGIADLGRVGPAIDPIYFLNTPSSYVWSGSPYPGNSSSCWGVDFGGGAADIGFRSVTVQVRLVRGRQ